LAKLKIDITFDDNINYIEDDYLDIENKYNNYDDEFQNKMKLKLHTRNLTELGNLSNDFNWLLEQIRKSIECGNLSNDVNLLCAQFNSFIDFGKPSNDLILLLEQLKYFKFL
jgi:hypothetical protein